MEQSISYSSAVSRLSSQERRRIFACGMWLRAGLVGMGALTVGVSGLLDGGMGAASALALTVAGAALTGVGLRLASAALDRPDGNDVVPAPGSSPTSGRTPAGAAPRFAGARPKFSA